MSDVFPADILCGSDPWILAGMHWLAHFFWKHISREMGTYSVISCHILLCAWLKNNCWKTFPPTSSILSLYWNCFCHSLGWFLLFSAKLSFQSREKWVTGQPPLRQWWQPSLLFFTAIRYKPDFRKMSFLQSWLSKTRFIQNLGQCLNVCRIRDRNAAFPAIWCNPDPSWKWSTKSGADHFNVYYKYINSFTSWTNLLLVEVLPWMKIHF